jgi:glutaredoxin
MKKTLLTSKWCGPCKLIKEKLQEAGIEVDVKEFDDVENLEFFRKHNIKGVPKLVIEKDDESVEIISGTDAILAALVEDKN